MLEKIFLNLLLSTELCIFGICSVSSNDKNIDVAKRSVEKKIPLNGDWAWMSSEYENSPAGLAVTTDCVAKNSFWTSATTKEENPAWAIDLQRLCIVQNVVVTVMNEYKGAKRFKDVYIFVTDIRPDLDRERDYKLSNAQFMGPASKHQKVKFTFTAKGRYIEIVLKHSRTALELCHVEIFGELVRTKIPLNGDLAWMSSEYRNSPAGLAVTTDCVANNYRWTSATKKEENPTWAIYLQRLYIVQVVVVTAMNDKGAKRFKDVYIFVTDNRPDLDGHKDFTLSNAHFEGPASKHQTVKFTFTAQGRYVEIVVKHSRTYLELCHVEIFGDLVHLTKIPLNGQWAWMTSEYKNSPAGLAVTTDCVTHNNPWTSATLAQEYPAWAIYLQRLYIVQNVVVTAMNDKGAERFKDIYIFVTEHRTNLDRQRDYKLSKAYFKGPASKHQTVYFTFTAKGRYVEMVMKYDFYEYLELCHVEMFGDLVTNTSKVLLDGSWAWMSSEYKNSPAGLAVTTDCVNKNYRWTSATTKEENPTWAIDLQRLYIVQNVVVTAMNEYKGAKRFKDVYIFVTDIRPDLDGHKDFTLSKAHYKGPASKHQTVNFTFTANGRYVEIVVKHSRTYLELCHVEIYAMGNAQVYVKLHLDDFSTAWMTSQLEYATAGRALKSFCDRFTKMASSTREEANPGWAIVLRKFFYVQNIEVTAINDADRARRFKDVYAFVTREKLVIDDYSPYFAYACAYFKGPASKHETVIFECNKIGQHVSIVLRNPRQYLELCKVAVYGSSELNAKEISLDPNLAWMTSEFTAAGLIAARPVRFTCSTSSYISSTNEQKNPGFAIYLKKKFYVTTIYVTVTSLSGEVHYFKEVHLFANEVMPDLGNLDYADRCAYYKGPPSPYETIGFECNKIGRYVALSLRSSYTILRLCHIDIYGLRWHLITLPLNSSSVKQSIDYDRQHYASRAIDGKFVNDYCTMTGYGWEPWWAIDLESLSFVNTVQMWTPKDHPDRYNGIRVLLAYFNVGPFLECAPASCEYPTSGIYKIQCNQLALRVKIELSHQDNQVLVLCEVIVYGEIANKLGPHSANQSSTYQHFVANNAIDGKNHQVYHNNVLSQTEVESDPWWSAELRRNSFVTFIQIWKLYYNAEDMENFKVFLSDLNESYQEECFGYHIPARSIGEIFLLHCGYVADKVKISVPGINQVLKIAQVEVYGYYEE